MLPEILIDAVDQRIAELARQLQHHRVDLLHRRARRRGLDRRVNQAIHLDQHPGRGRGFPGALIQRLDMMKITLVLIQGAEQRVALKMAAMATLQHLGHALLQLITA